ncbi:MAG TPA: flavoprotein [Jatrophihabitantaceae bacterium]|nr:flavoprotein [Jatrophihabitantaceae bacterium]
MTGPTNRMLYIVVCGAGPASDVGRLVLAAQYRGWQVNIIATPAALDFVNVVELEKLTSNPVRSEYRKPGVAGGRSLPAADAIICAPATYNTINKLALGVSDTYALGILAESIGMGIPTVALPFVNTALASRAPFQQAVKALRGEGVRVLLGPGELEPHPPGTGGERIAAFPWDLALDEADRLSS